MLLIVSFLQFFWESPVALSSVPVAFHCPQRPMHGNRRPSPVGRGQAQGALVADASPAVQHCRGEMYIDEYDQKMAWIAKDMSGRDVHLMHSPQMIDDFRARYDSPAQYEFLSPSFASLPLGQPRRAVPQTFRLGFLANLTFAKG